MSGLLRALLVGLVLLNLAFVHLTGAADLRWLGPLVGLTIACPLLLPLRRFLAYRLAWNGAVVTVFALLVRHASSAGAQYLLEDGLLLAALCQVHLLNNIGNDQKPDLIFFNSFLIAVVTSFLTFEFGYSLVFLLYAPVLVLALQVNVLDRPGRRAGAGLGRRVLLDGGVRVAAVLAATLLVFFLLPRDFSRRGLVGKNLRWQSGDLLSPGFSEKVELGREGRMAGGGERVVMTVAIRSGPAAAVPGAWRGATLDRFDGRNWRPFRGRAEGSGESFMPVGEGTFVRSGREPGAVTEVELRDPSSGRLFVPLDATRVAVETPSVAGDVTPAPDLTFLCPAGARSSGPVRYEVGISSGRARLGGAVGAGARRVSSIFVRYDPAVVPRAAAELARRLRTEAGAGAPQHVVVERFRARLSADYRWLPPGAPGGAATLSEFFGGAAGAHCEVFATALAVMLRSGGIPCRLVTGYRSEEWDAAGTVLTFRDRHAHAWVEVFDPEGGWYAVDPSPLPAEGEGAGGGLLDGVTRALALAWRAVTNFTEDGRKAAFAWIAALPGRAVDLARERPLPLGAILALLAGWLAARRRRRPRGPAEVRAYRAAVRRARLVLRPGETPRALLIRARRTALHPSRLRALEAATGAHERARYAAVSGRARGRPARASPAAG